VTRGDAGPVEVRSVHDAWRERLALRGTCGQARDVRRQLGVVVGEQRVPPMLEKVTHPARAHCDHGETGATRLERGDAERLAHRRQHEQVRRCVCLAERFARARTCERHRAVEPEPITETLERVSFRAVAKDREVQRQPRIGFSGRSEGLDQGRRPLLSVQPHRAHHANHARVGSRSTVASPGLHIYAVR